MLVVTACLAGLLPACGCITREADFVPATTALPAEGVCVPVVLENGVPFIEATVNGRGPYRFLFDTGAPPLAVSDKVARELHLPATFKRAVSVGPDGVEARPRPVVAVRTLGLGGALFGDFHASVKDAEALAHLRPECDGVLGLAPFKNCLVTLDLPGRQLRLERGRLVEPAGRLERVRVPRTDFAGSVSRVPVLFNRRDSDPVVYRMIVDTGFNGGLAMPAEAGSDAFGWGESCEVTYLNHEGKQSRASGGVLDARVVVGGVVFEHPVAHCVAGPTGMIGTRILQSFVLTFDQAHGLTRFSRPGLQAKAPPRPRPGG